MPNALSLMTYITVALSIQPKIYSAVAFTTTTRFGSIIHSAKFSKNARFKPNNRAILYMSTSSDTNSLLQSGISRIGTLQTLLSKHGASGSQGCKEPNDLVPVSSVDIGQGELLDLHPQLYPISKSKTSGNYICALRRASKENEGGAETGATAWPIVEGGINFPGMRLLSLNSEHFMRRIAAEADDSGGDGDEIIALYNEGLGQSKIKDKGLDTPYEPGSVAKLGYGVEKYTLLRVGPFPDLYETMALQHASKNDESSSLIAAEASNGKFPGFGSTFVFYAQLLLSFPNREEESRDAARMCLRLPLPTLGLTKDDFANVSRMADFATEDDSIEEAIAKLQVMYEKIRNHEKEENDDSGKTPEQVALDEANYLLDTTALTGGKWRSIREKLGDIYREAGKEEMAKFVDPSRS